MYLSKNIFETVIDSTPLVSIDILVENELGQYLLGLRRNSPAKGAWFVPGGRIRKNEPFIDAFQRITMEELGYLGQLDDAEYIGHFEHFYNDSAVSEHVSTHYIAFGYKLNLSQNELALPPNQHSDYCWMHINSIMKSSMVHDHTKWYFSQDKRISAQ